MMIHYEITYIDHKTGNEITTQASFNDLQGIPPRQQAKEYADILSNSGKYFIKNKLYIQG